MNAEEVGTVAAVALGMACVIVGVAYFSTGAAWIVTGLIILALVVGFLRGE